MATETQRNSVPKKRMRGNKSLRVCPVVNNEAGSIHLECIQKHNCLLKCWGTSALKTEQALTQTLLERSIKESGCRSALNEEKLGVRIFSSQSVCVCVCVCVCVRARAHQAEREWGDKLKSCCWKWL